MGNQVVGEEDTETQRKLEIVDRPQKKETGIQSKTKCLTEALVGIGRVARVSRVATVTRAPRLVRIARVARAARVAR